MSYKCDRCQKYEPGKPIRVVVETREVQHSQIVKDEYGNQFPVNTGVGTQIVREENVCSPSCEGKRRR